MTTPNYKCILCSVRDMEGEVSAENACAYGICFRDAIPMEKLAPTICDYHAAMLVTYYDTMIEFAKAYEQAKEEAAGNAKPDKESN